MFWWDLLSAGTGGALPIMGCPALRTLSRAILLVRFAGESPAATQDQPAQHGGKMAGSRLSKVCFFLALTV